MSLLCKAAYVFLVCITSVVSLCMRNSVMMWHLVILVLGRGLCGCCGPGRVVELALRESAEVLLVDAGCAVRDIDLGGLLRGKVPTSNVRC